MSPIVNLRPRFLKPLVEEALDHSKVVAVVGPRQSGKTTLCVEIAKERGMTYLSMDHETDFRKAVKEPHRLIEDDKSYFIDEIQKVPNLILAVKMSSDRSPFPGTRGRFLVSGSIHPFRAPTTPDTLAGRVHLLKLLPLSAGELLGFKNPLAFFDHIFSDDLSPPSGALPAPQGLMGNIYEQMVRGGFPDAHIRSNDLQREGWLKNYAFSLMDREIVRMNELKDADVLLKILLQLSKMGGGVLNFDTLSKTLAISQDETKKWLTLFHISYLIHLLPAWHGGKLSNMGKSSKLYFVDPGVLSALEELTAEKLLQAHAAPNRPKNKKIVKSLGRLTEGFIFAELAKLIALTHDQVKIYHFRDKNQAEVDFVLQERSDKVVGIEVKASKSISADDFNGLKALRASTGHDFHRGIVLYLGDKIQVHENGLYALPYHTLYSLDSTMSPS